MKVFDVLRRLVRNSDRIDAVVEGIDNQSKQLAAVLERLSALIEGVDQLSRQMARIIECIDDQSGAAPRSLIAELVELQKAQLVMQRDHAEAIDDLTAALTASKTAGAKSLQVD